jgi:hypothetical protein
VRDEDGRRDRGERGELIRMGWILMDRMERKDRKDRKDAEMK